MRCIILIIASRGPFYDKMATIWRKYLNTNPEIRGYLIYGNDCDINPADDIIIAPFPETYTPGILQKTVYAFEKINVHEYDFVFRTNLSSFVVLDRMLEFMKTLPTSNCYCSEFHYPNPVSNRDVYPALKKRNLITDFAWGNGAGIFFSKDIIKSLIANKHRLPYDIIDDVTLGIFMKRVYPNVPRIEQPRYCIYADPLNPTHIDKIKNNHHIRIKTKQRNDEPKLLEKLYNIFYTK